MSGSWYNGQLPSFSEWANDLYLAQVIAERDVWKRRAEKLRDEIANIGASIKQRGYWECPLENGDRIMLVMKPAEPGPTEQ
jgi:hypothetical protein